MIACNARISWIISLDGEAMPKKIVSLVMLMIISLFTFCGCGEQVYDDTEIDLSEFFGNSKGCAVFYKNGDYYTYGNDMINERKSPCSTFKIVLTLAGLKYGILKDENTLIKWGGHRALF